ncbi:MAG: hypothetical protein PHR06_08850 [Candidatus Cloacimonetes bacterium]|nr:hypothetical protein [Candidatus Cloacimonadota bacterium]
MKKIIILLFLWQVSLVAIQYETASLKSFIYDSAPDCEYDNFQSHVVEGENATNNLYAPFDRQLRGFGNFFMVSPDSLSGQIILEKWQFIVTSFINGDFQSAERQLLASNIPYSIVEFYDIDTARTYYMLRENLNLNYYDDNNTPDYPNDDESGSFDYGWGLFLMNQNSMNPLIVHSVHPCDDFITLPICVKAFQDWDARYLMFSSSGRGVLGFNNDTSLSDPSRNSDHPFNSFYKQACLEIRSFAERELVFQLHSFDRRTINFPACLISANYHGDNTSDLPIRDHSSNMLDIINLTDYIVFPENTVGTHSQITINEYYAVNYSSEYDFYYHHADSLIVVKHIVSLSGVDSPQMNFTAESNFYDVTEQYVHVEFHELPNQYGDSNENYLVFYGYNPNTGNFDFNNLFTKALHFYTPFIDAVTAALTHYYSLNDEQTPLPVDNLRLETYGSQQKLCWNKTDSFDFYSYEITLTSSETGEIRYFFDRQNSKKLACASQEFIVFDDVNLGERFDAAIRCKDYHNNYSSTATCSFFLGPIEVSDFKAVGLDNEVFLEWNTGQCTDQLTFLLERRQENDPSVETIFQTTTQPNQSYTFHDVDVENSIQYNYNLEIVYPSGYHVTLRSASVKPERLFSLGIENSLQTNKLIFSSNLFATDGFDEGYDIEIDESEDDQLKTAFVLSDDENVLLLRDIKDIIDMTLESKNWQIRIYSDTPYPVIISIPDDIRNQNEIDFILFDRQTHSYTDLLCQNYSFVPQGEHFFDLIVGKSTPGVFDFNTDKYIYTSDNHIVLSWKLANQFVINSQILQMNVNNFTFFDVWHPPVSYQNSFSYSIPEAIISQESRFRITLNTDSHGILYFEAQHPVLILPSTNSIILENGWSIVANPFEESIAVPQDEAEILFWNNSVFEECNSLLPGKAMLVNAPDGLEISSEQNPTSQEMIFPLHTGWNIIPNPHYFAYKIEDIKIVNYNNEMSFREAVISNLVTHSVYFYHNGYVIANEIGIAESFFIYSHCDDISLKLAPFQSGESTDTPDFFAKFCLTTCFENLQSDNLILYLKESASIDFNQFLDTIEPPLLPVSSPVSFYTTKQNDSTSIHLNEDFRPYSQLFSQSFPFQISLPDSGHTTISLNECDSEIDLHCYIQIGDEFAEISADNDFGFEGNGVVDGIFMITTEAVGNVSEFINPKKLRNYPNPFRAGDNERSSGTVINFSIPSEGKVELNIYNLLGQNVKYLVDHRLGMGDHEIFWSGCNNQGKKVASGIYFYTLSLNGRRLAANKMLLLK